MKRHIFFFLIIASFLSCNRNNTGVEDLISPPELIPSPADTAFIEIGIDASDSENAIQLDWTQGDEEKPDKYRIYRREGSDEEAAFELLGAISGNQTVFIDDTNIKLGVRYFYYVTAAIGNDDEESEPSNIEHYTLLEKPFRLSNTAETKPQFTWSIHNVPEIYILKVINTDTNTPVWIGSISSSYQAQEVIDSAELPNFPELNPNSNYKWRVDVVGSSENSGCESSWTPITF